ncbi:TrkH family potassium uptake protein [Ideonella livida]|uniref:Trk system potassium uptake protein n=1 Tax=Ideonella livida TaxID=2707176 RepID=A0A7C9PL11_9BURK|nr:potassium transporter TrkG [Ideonella livida]NDY93974.1 TrkH family potassium uptake protein [Ideonella livida]
MRHYFPVFTVLGGVIMLFSLTMLVPLGFSWGLGDGAHAVYDEAILATLAAGLFLFLACRGEKRELQPRDGFLLVTLVWTVLPAFGTLPLLLAIPGLSFTDAYFEAMSGMTTTGATVLTGLEHLPASLNVWRCFMVLLGGMGILVLAVAILPLLGVGGSQIFKAETPGPMKDEKLTPRIAETARGLWAVYFTVATACMLALHAAGMGWTDAFMHMCSVMGLGGFAGYDASFGAFDSPLIEAVAIFFMLLAGINFALYFLAWRQRSWRVVFTDLEARFFWALMAGSVALVTVLLLAHGTYPDALTALRHAAFSVISVATTTGFATVDYAQWPIFAPVLMLFLCGFATCAGSTGGGIKLVRSLLLMKQAQREFTRIVHPRAVVPVTLGERVVPPEVLASLQGFMLIYGAVMTAATLALLATGLDVITAFTAVVACLNNTGPGLGQVGPSGNYQGLSDVQTWICTLTMLLGRLELFAVLVLFSPGFWRK